MKTLLRFSPLLLLSPVLALPLLFAAEEPQKLPNTETDLSAPLMSAQDAASGMKVPPGFDVTVFASEPDVQNPIATAFDDRGRLWVAENYTYAEKSQRFDLSLNDRVLIFEDTDGDGRADERTVFTDQVQMLTSVEIGKGGVWLMCPPQVLFIPDADGDGVPDGPPQVVLDGFTVSDSNYHNFANGLRWGPDGWLYGRCGHSCPGNLGVPGTPDEDRIPMDGGMWRFHPEKKIVEVLCHGTTNPWGHDWDENGELFYINTVNGHLWHVMPGAHFKEHFGQSRNPGVYERMDMIADHYHFDTSGSWMDSRDGAANSYGGGHAHSGMMIYQGGRWPERFHGKLFTINFHGRRANVERLERQGAGYVGKHEPDTFIMSDPWFRGLEIRVGPDGNAYIADWSDTGECHEHTGVHRESGRIYKVSYGKAEDAAPFAKPFCLANDNALAALWREYQAGETTPEMLRALLDDPDEHVRVWAIRLLTDFWPLDTVIGPRANAIYPQDEKSIAKFIEMARDDESSLVHLVLASTLQRLPIDRRAELATELVKHERYASDRDLPMLVWYGLIPVGDQSPETLAGVGLHCTWPTSLRYVARHLAVQSERESGPLNSLIAGSKDRSSELQVSILKGMSEAYSGWRKAPEPAAWDAFVKAGPKEHSPQLVRELNILFGDGRALDEVKQIALSKKADFKSRKAALQTLIEARPTDLREICESLLDTKSLNAVAVRGLALYSDPDIGKKLATRYRRFHPEERPAVIDTLVSRPTFAKSLLENVGTGKSQVNRADITASHARQILSFKNDELSDLLAEVWGEIRDTPADRKAVMDKLRGNFTPEVVAGADLAAGRLLYRKSCANCHELYNEGKKVGPNLTGSQRSNLDYLLQNIVDPSAVVSADYKVTSLVLFDGRVLNGIVTSRNDRTLTIRTATELKTLPIDEIDEEYPSALSLMPDNILQTLSEEQIRDLFAYLMHPVQVQLDEEDSSETD
ncbi:PVC-type heme-binding CxxCH protein [Stratiformator vulcanicus]|uniref:Cytochrome c n=1 Tax=Stratiformator vulcanicus TaxID=2527980 RepID=A0A517QXM6_9PLAN|nr:PVC-type heme-binding CxxCH protein [Stratiformator vulcanicus]QDT36399.1 Cytochrome c [Stratiformator vulcanicus]